MGKIIKKSIEKIIVNKKKFSLGMKGEFKIEFTNDSFGPYNYKFERTDCYFNDGLEDRGTKIFPIKNVVFDNTEIFLETDDVIICVGERGSLLGGEKSFIDIINIKTEKKYRLFTSEINLIFNSEDKIIVNALDEGVFKTLVIDLKTMKKIEEVPEELQAFFKCVYNKTTKEWFMLDFDVKNKEEKDEEKKHQHGSFILQSISLTGEPKSFDRKRFEVKTGKGLIDIWKNSNR